MYELEVQRVISCAHHVNGYCGKCSALHGHNYRITLVLRADALDELGMACDFRKIKDAADAALAGYDHACLNDLPDFREVNPTSENLARVLYRKLAPALTSGNTRLHAVRIAESDSSSASYMEP